MLKFMNISFAKFGAFQLLWRLLALVFVEERGDQIIRTPKSEHGSKIISRQVGIHYSLLMHRRRRWGGAGGALAPPVGVRCWNFGQNFGQFHISGNLASKFWASLPTKVFRALDRKTVSTWVKTFFFFWRAPSLDRITVSIWVKIFFFREHFY